MVILAILLSIFIPGDVNFDDLMSQTYPIECAGVYEYEFWTTAGAIYPVKYEYKFTEDAYELTYQLGGANVIQEGRIDQDTGAQEAERFVSMTGRDPAIFLMIALRREHKLQRVETGWIISDWCGNRKDIHVGENGLVTSYSGKSYGGWQFGGVLPMPGWFETKGRRMPIWK